MAQYARHRGVSRQAVYKALERRIGEARLPDGRIDAEAADKLWLDNTNPGMTKEYREFIRPTKTPRPYRDDRPSELAQRVLQAARRCEARGLRLPSVAMIWPNTYDDPPFFYPNGDVSDLDWLYTPDELASLLQAVENAARELANGLDDLASTEFKES
ncbi:MAG: hypothetical protein KGM83_11315 [Betaproteobacteria bacterium]|nr:hypothetical protein [Betaproteobacteria bacterium]